MSDANAREAQGADLVNTEADLVNTEEDAGASEGVETTGDVTLVELSHGVALWCGEVPDGIELVDLDLVPSLDLSQFSTVLGSIGNASTFAGNTVEAIASAKGLFRISDASQAILSSGGHLALKDGANLGAIFNNGKIVAQARFIPVSTAPSRVVAGIGPAVAMLALQMQLGEISRLTRANVALTTQTLKTIRHEQWSELEGLAESVKGALEEARELRTVTDTMWEPVASSQPTIRKQLKLCQRNVSGHVQQLGKLEGQARRHYLESNADAIVFDTHALLSSLKTYAGYQALRATLARTRSDDNEDEARLFDRITHTTPTEIDESLQDISHLTRSLVRELRIIAELPGRATIPLTKKHRDNHASQLTCAELLTAIDPLAQLLQPVVEVPTIPDTVCAPEGLDLTPYMQVLRWFLEDGEDLRGIAFPYVIEMSSWGIVIPALLGMRVDAAWEALKPGKTGKVAGALASNTFVAVTNRRVMTAVPKTLLNEGQLGSTYALEDVKYVRPRSSYQQRVRPTIGVTTRHSDAEWLFPATLDPARIDALATVLSEGALSETTGRVLSTGEATAAAIEE